MIDAHSPHLAGQMPQVYEPQSHGARPAIAIAIAALLLWIYSVFSGGALFGRPNIDQIPRPPGRRKSPTVNIKLWPQRGLVEVLPMGKTLKNKLNARPIGPMLK